jgi:pyruvate,water dikinase
MTDAPLVLWLADLSRKDGDKVGGKNASLGEMIRSLHEAGVRVPGGFATTATAYWQFIDANELRDKKRLGELKDDRSNLDAVGSAIRELITGGEFPAPLKDAITRSYQDMGRAWSARIRASRCAAAPRRKTCRRRASPASSRPF